MEVVNLGTLGRKTWGATKNRREIRSTEKCTYIQLYTHHEKKKENMRWHRENTKMSVLENGKWKSSTAAMTTVNCISADLVMGDGSASI